MINKNKGSILIEIAITLPIVIIIVLSIQQVSYVFKIYSQIDYCISMTANDLALYSYIPEGLYINDTIHKKTTNLQVKSNLGKANIYQLIGNVENISLESLKNILNGNNAKDIISNIGEKNIEEVLYYIGEIAVRESKDITEDFIVEKIFWDYMSEEEKNNIEHWVIGGKKGIDFKKSSILDDGKTIEVIAEYTLFPKMIIKLIPKLEFQNRKIVYAILRGKSIIPEDKLNNKITSIWTMRPMDRGKTIQKLEGRNLPANYPVIAIFNANSGRAVSIKSINTEEKTYQKTSNLSYRIKRMIKELNSFQGGKCVDIIIKKGDIKEKTLILIIPEIEETEVIRKAFLEARNYAEAHRINLIIKKAYGIP